MAQLTKTQNDAYELLRQEGTLYAYNGVSHATITALESRGLVTVTRSVQTRNNRRSGRNHSQRDWSATLKG